MTKMTCKLIKLQLKLKKKPKVKEEYLQLDEVSMWQSCSKTLLLLLSKVSPSLNKTLCAGLIGNIIRTAVILHPSMLQIALGLLAREKKSNNYMPLVHLLPTMKLGGTRFRQLLPQIF